MSKRPPTPSEPSDGGSPTESPPRLVHPGQVDGLLFDPVERWKALALTRLKADASENPRRGIRLRIGGSFVLVCLFTGLTFGRTGPALVFGGLLSVVLVQELPRALLLRLRGHSSTVHVLGGGGRIAGMDAPGECPEIGASNWVGSLANGLAAVVLVVLARSIASGEVAPALGTLTVWHTAWGFGQGLPMLPFRAGEVLQRRLSPRARLPYVGASFMIVSAIPFALGPLLPQLLPVVAMAIMGAWTAVVDSYQERSDLVRGIDAAAALAEQSLLAGDPKRAIDLARTALPRAHTDAQRVRLRKAILWGAIGAGDPFLAHHALSEIPEDAIDAYLVASYLSACNRLDEAVSLLEEARSAGYRSKETTKLLIEVWFRRGDTARALSIAHSGADLLSAEERAAVEAAVASSRSPHVVQR